MENGARLTVGAHEAVPVIIRIKGLKGPGPPVGASVR